MPQGLVLLDAGKVVQAWRRSAHETVGQREPGQNEDEWQRFCDLYLERTSGPHVQAENHHVVWHAQLHMEFR